MSGPKIGITGSYGGLNLGDEAILQSILEQLRHEVPDAEITVFSRDAEDTKRRHKVERAVPVRKLSRSEVVPEVERLDLLLFGGGGILYDADARTYLREVTLMFRVVEFQRDNFEAYVTQNPKQWRGVHGLWDLVREASERGELRLPREDILFFATPHEEEVSVNSTRVTRVLGTDVWDLSYAEWASRRQMRQIA